MLPLDRMDAYTCRYHFCLSEQNWAQVFDGVTCSGPNYTSAVCTRHPSPCLAAVYVHLFPVLFSSLSQSLASRGNHETLLFRPFRTGIFRPIRAPLRTQACERIGHLQIFKSSTRCIFGGSWYDILFHNFFSFLFMWFCFSGCFHHLWMNCFPSSCSCVAIVRPTLP